MWKWQAYPPSAGKGVRVVAVEVEGAQGNLKGTDGRSSRGTSSTARFSQAEGQVRGVKGGRRGLRVSVWG